MKVLVCGGRNYSDNFKLARVLDQLHQTRAFSCLIHGGATGADSLADLWARQNGIQPVRCDALWDFYRKQGNTKAAGPIRNKNMIELFWPKLVVAFPGGTGTAGMIKLAKTNAIEVVEIGL